MPGRRRSRSDSLEDLGPQFWQTKQVRGFGLRLLYLRDGRVLHLKNAELLDAVRWLELIYSNPGKHGNAVQGLKRAR